MVFFSRGADNHTGGPEGPPVKVQSNKSAYNRSASEAPACKGNKECLIVKLCGLIYLIELTYRTKMDEMGSKPTLSGMT